MAIITFPRDKPDELRLVDPTFRLLPMQEITPLRSGGQVAANLGPSLWAADFTSKPLRGRELGIVRAWFDTLASVEECYVYDPRFQYPVSYTAAQFAALTASGSPWNGTGILATVAANNVEIGLDNLSDTFKLRPGDYLSFNYGSSSRALHRAAASADAVAGEMTIEVRPHVRPGWDGGSPLPTVTFYRAAARMFIVPNSYSERASGSLVAVSFQAIQSL